MGEAKEEAKKILISFFESNKKTYVLLPLYKCTMEAGGPPEGGDPLENFSFFLLVQISRSVRMPQLHTLLCFYLAPMVKNGWSCRDLI